MKKANKIFTRAFIILLAMVLLTSSAVSTTFAKYVVTKDAKTTVGLQKFGLTVELDATALGTAATTKKTGNSISLTYNAITLKPGDLTYKDAIKASISGEATVPADVTIKIEITECDDSKFTITGDDFTGYSTKVYNPIEFYVAGVECGIGNKQENPGTNVIENMYEGAFSTKLGTAIANTTGITKTASSGGVFTGTIAEGATVELANANLGFVWENATGNDANEISTFIADKEPKFTVTYTITVEQNN